MNVYDIAIARALSSGGGGGGGDLYTAEVSVIDSIGYMFYPVNMDTSKIVGVAENETIGLTDFNVDQGDPTSFVGNQNFTWYILNNESIYLMSQGANSIVASGSAEVFEVEGMKLVRIYGDCTITIS